MRNIFNNLFFQPSVLMMRNQNWQRMAVDQFLFAPVFISVFMSRFIFFFFILGFILFIYSLCFRSLLILEGKFSSVSARLRGSWVDAVKSNWAIWIPAQLLNFKFIPLPYQVGEYCCDKFRSFLTIIFAGSIRKCCWIWVEHDIILSVIQIN